jgi:hypothetical protein
MSRRVASLNFVGRERELAHLSGAVLAAGDGRPAFVLVLSGKGAEACQRGEEALALARAAGNRAEEGRILNTVGPSLAMPRGHRRDARRRSVLSMNTTKTTTHADRIFAPRAWMFSPERRIFARTRLAGPAPGYARPDVG